MRAMIRLIGLVISIAVADSLNPSTIGPALFLAGGDHARTKVAEFTFGVFAVYLLGGAAIALGPGQLVLALVPHPDRTVRHDIEIAVGAAMLLAAALLWRFRTRLAARQVKAFSPEGRSSVALGATIMAVELPTAFPYFAAIAAIVGSGFDPIRQLILLLLFNVCFVLPLLGIMGAVTFGRERAAPMLARARQRLEARWPAVLATLALLAGVFVILLGVTGILGPHSRISRLLHHLPGFKHP
jgi:cytochrome c biogenesis protein CcdA